MAECFLAQSGGGGASLNFKVKDYATEEQLMAVKGKVNEIGIITSTPMTGWHFVAEQPENLQPGEVWISTGASSEVAFNAAKKNTVMVYPISAKQMLDDGSLVDVNAKIWQNGEWADFIDWSKVLYNRGDVREDLSGGWASYIYQDQNHVTVKNTAEYLSIVCANTTYGQGWCSSGKKVSLNGVNRINLTYTMDNAPVYMYFTVSKTQTGTMPSSVTDNYPAFITLQQSTAEITVPLEVASLSGEYYVKIGGAFKGCELKAYSIMIE